MTPIRVNTFKDCVTSMSQSVAKAYVTLHSFEAFAYVKSTLN